MTQLGEEDVVSERQDFPATIHLPDVRIQSCNEKLRHFQNSHVRHTKEKVGESAAASNSHVGEVFRRREVLPCIRV